MEGARYPEKGSPESIDRPYITHPPVNVTHTHIHTHTHVHTLMYRQKKNMMIIDGTRVVKDHDAGKI